VDAQVLFVPSVHIVDSKLKKANSIPSHSGDASKVSMATHSLIALAVKYIMIVYFPAIKEPNLVFSANEKDTYLCKRVLYYSISFAVSLIHHAQHVQGYFTKTIIHHAHCLPISHSVYTV
jgi:hypothetical protein